MTTSRTSPSTTTARRTRWRVVDIVVASVVAVACGVLFTAWIAVSDGPGQAIGAALPGAQGLINGPWLIAGPLAGVIVRKPGAALYAEFVAAAIELLFYPAYGAAVLLSGLVQGLGAEIVFAVFAYRAFGVVPALLSGALSGLLGSALLDIWSYPSLAALQPQFKVVYVLTTVVSGAVFGLLCVPLVRAVARTGALDRFASGRSARRTV